MGAEFATNLKLLLTQMSLSSAQLAKAVNVDPSLVSRWLRSGCGTRKASAHALAIGRYVCSRRLSPENAAWLSAAVGYEQGRPVTAERVALWLYPDSDLPAPPQEEPFANILVVNSFRDSVLGREPAGSADASLSVCRGAKTIAQQLSAELEKAEPGCCIDIFLSSEAVTAAVDKHILLALRQAVANKPLSVRMLVQSANNSAMSTRLVSTYLPLLVLGRLTLSMIQGTPQTFTANMHVLIPDGAAIVVTEAVSRKSAAVATVIREPELVCDMRENFEATIRYARPLMTAYDDSFARNIIEAFFEEYGVPGSLDVIKSGLNPMYMSVEHYGRVLEKFGHTGEQYQWRYNEFVRFKSAMDEVLKTSRFREVLSLAKLRQIAQARRCRMPSMYFMEAGVWYLDAEDCIAILDGYIRYLEQIPDFQVVLLEDDSLFVEDSCWHIKNNKHVMIHSWSVDRPIMVYSDQLLLIDEFQRHFDHLWSRISNTVGNKRAALESLKAIRTEIFAQG